MLKYLKEMFTGPQEESQGGSDTNDNKLQIAACALLLEIAMADDDFSEEEKNRITEIMKTNFGFSKVEVEKLIAKSEEEIKDSISIYEFTDILNKHLNSNEKYSVLKYLWQVAYADGNLDAYEDHYIKKISNNLHLYNKDRITAKLEVKKELGL